MPNNKGVVSIGLNVDYEKSLQEMTSAFKTKLTELSNEFEKVEFSKNTKAQFDAISAQIEQVSKDAKAMFNEVNNGKLDAETFKTYQTKVTQNFNNMKTNIKGLSEEISKLDVKIDGFSGTDIASNMVEQFDGISRSVVGAYEEISKLVDIVDKVNSGRASDIVDIGAIKQAIAYKDALGKIKEARKEYDSYNSEKKISSLEELDLGTLDTKVRNIEHDLLVVIETYNQAKKDIENSNFANKSLEQLNAELMTATANVEAFVKAGQTIDDIAFNNPDLDTSNYSGLSDLALDKADAVLAENRESLLEYTAAAEVFIEKNKEAAQGFEQLSTSAKSFYFKDGAVQIPIDIMPGTLVQDKLDDVVKYLQDYIKDKPIFVKIDTKNEAENAVKKVQGEFDKSKIKITMEERVVGLDKVIEQIKEVKNIINDDQEKSITLSSFFDSIDLEKLEKLLNTINATGMSLVQLNQIAETNGIIGFQKDISKLYDTLNGLPKTMSDTKGFKFGLDEASIKRITDAIENMANMIKKAFNVASDEDIASQWAVIEEKFKGVAGEAGKIDGRNKANIESMRELATEYKKYLDMGGTNELSALTKHKPTVNNLTKAYEQLGQAVQEVSQKQEKQKTTSKTSTADSENIKSTTKANKNLETQADKTSTAIENEGNAAQSASEKFKKLAEEKNAAVVANKELAETAERTARALKDEAEAKKSSGSTKPNKNAVDATTYNSNFLKWQNEIKQSLLDSGNYAEVYEAKITQAENGNVKFTATVRDLNGELKKFSAKVNSSGEIFSPSASDMLEKMDAESTFYDQDKMDAYSSKIKEATQNLKDLKVARISFNSDGGLTIAGEMKDASGETKQFTANFKNASEVVEETADGIISVVDNIEEKLKSGFDSGKVTSSIKDYTGEAQKLLDGFRLKNEGDLNFSAIRADLDKLEQVAKGLNTPDSFNKFNKELSEIGVKLKNISANNKLGSLFKGNNQTFKDITEVKDNLNSLFATMGKINEKSIKVKNMNSLTAEVKQANGEIHKMTVNLDKDGFARYVDNGIVQFGRLREAAEGVFKGIQQMVRIYLSPQDFIRYFRQGFDSVKEVDTALTELRKVSDASAGELANYFDDAVVSAKDLGSSVNDMISATADWARLGYNLPDSKELGEVAVLYKNVGDGIDIEEANSSLVSTLQGFQMNASEAIDIVDKFNEVIVRCPLISKCYI